MKESIPKATKMVNTNARPNARYIFEMKRIHGTAGKNSARISPPVYNPEGDRFENLLSANRKIGSV